jgi:hypothetical protein
MGHCGFIMAHGRELRVYRRLLIVRVVYNRSFKYAPMHFLSVDLSPQARIKM